MIDITKLETLIAERVGNTDFTIVRLAYTGSVIFKGLDNLTKDLDIRVVCSDLYEDYIKVYYPPDEDYKYDIMIYSLDYYTRTLRFETGDYREIYGVLHPWDIVVIDTVNIQWNILDYKVKALEIVKKFLMRLPYYSDKISVKKFYEKDFINCYLATKVLDNNSAELTDEMKSKVLELYNEAGHDAIYWLTEYYGLTLYME